MYLSHGAYYYVDRPGTWHRLGRDYSEALRRYAKLIEPATARIDALIARYELEVLPQRASVTARGRKQEFKNIRKVFGAMPPQDLRGSHAWQYFQERGRTSGARHELRALSAVMGWAVKWGVVDRNPLTNLQLPGTKPRKRYVTDAEYSAVRAIAPLMVGVAMDIALITALRQHDILQLERRQIDGGLLTVTARKTGKQIAFPVAGELKEAIDQANAAPPQLRRFVIVNRAGKPYSRDGFQSQWQRLIKRAFRLGIIQDRFTFHDLRAKNLSDVSSLEEARKRAQHSDARVTQAVYRRLPETVSVMNIGHLRRTKK